ncbi:MULTISPECIES: LCP family protein [unclassified Geobacillus]|uniref:LCP family protein n=1 Tax=unclassified Geobacillus TaxID=2642459 RepID=UPI000BE233D7|nr:MULTISPECIES: LCP family protein [unclassified Geobacillus]PDM39224.1 transcriptional regulator [Parageobacillus yumthangensis]RDV22616.1 LytR family transcriptional regulator [Parageobacillus toebii]TXK92058.1 LytR family transcriptional regulator [Parageobacillus sp. SY1]PUF87789.1 transcriptional regulator [Geobacillus sp. LYN3]TXK88423.1 LytR family transcriptional regulator [Geobacillus sp. AYS3]
MVNERKRLKKMKKKKRRRRILFWLFVPCLLFLISSAGYALFLMHKAESMINKSYEEIGNNAKSIDPKKDNFSVLFIGIDDSKSRNFKSDTRSDALILATFNAKDKSVKMVSIPRDSYVYIPCEDKYDKITHAHAYGGTKCTVESIENLFDIHIDYYVKMNFYAFMDVVDALGGIEVEVPYDIKEKDSEDHHNAIVLKKGLQKLNGEEALALARTRKKDNDIERGKRQQQILKAILEKASKTSSITKYDDVIEAVGGNMKTNFTFDQMKSLVHYVIGDKKLTIESLYLKGTDHNDGIYYYMLDEDSVQEIGETLQNHLQSSDSTSTDKNSNEEQ